MCVCVEVLKRAVQSRPCAKKSLKNVAEEGMIVFGEKERAARGAKTRRDEKNTRERE